MQSLRLDLPSSRPLRVLCVGAHSDDIEIGCAGFLLQLLRGRRPIDVDWVVFSADGPREEEARRSAELLLRGARKRSIAVHHYRDGFFPYEGEAIKETFEGLKSVEPDLVLTHHRDDRHQDHRALSDLAWNTFRDHLVLEYEIPKYDGELGSPNCFVPLEKGICERKLKHLQRAFGTQRGKHWFDGETFRGLMRLRGVECRSRSGYAEGFHARKAVIQLP
jgi:LmbE family N-acetylglucosaminyl deacetylase